MEGLERIETAKDILAEGLASFDKDIQTKAEKARALHEENATLEQTMADLAADFEQKQAEFSEKTVKNREIHEKLLADIEQVRKELETARAELKTAKKQHKDFMDYRTRANAALEARESAILEKESKLDSILSSAKRRTSVLANL